MDKRVSTIAAAFEGVADGVEARLGKGIQDGLRQHITTTLGRTDPCIG
jgi:hypothetical protein